MITTSQTVFACYSKACAPPPAGKGGSTPGVQGPSKKMSDPIIHQWKASMARTEPGRGASVKDDGVPGDKSIKIKSIPNVSTERLERRLKWLNDHTQGAKALHSFDQPKRSLVHYGVNRLAIQHELKLRNPHFS